MGRELVATEDPQWKRAGRHGAVLNTDQKALEQYKRQRGESLAVKQLIADVEALKRDQATILELLRKLVTNG